MSKQASMTAPVLTDVEAGALTALLTHGTEVPDSIDGLDTDSPATAALVNVASARDALSNATGTAFATLGTPRWGMAVAVFGAVEAGATRLAIAETAGINRTIVGQYARFPGRLALVADALGMPRANAVKVPSLVEAVWVYGARANDERFTTLVETVEGIAASEVPADVEPWAIVSDAANAISLARAGSKSETGDETDGEPVTDADGVVVPAREAELLAAIETILTIAADATDDERSHLDALVATLTGK
jgi:hypothetical protein